MDVARPEFLDYRPWLIVFAIVVALLSIQQAWAQRQSIAAGFSKRFGPAFSLWRALLKVGLWGAAAWFLLIALATPLGDPVKIESESNGADVIMAVDVSSSMYAQDVKPNRLLALKALFENFINRLEGDRVALVAFAGDAVIACPLTTDYETAVTFLDKLDTDSVPSDGTGFAPAIKLCLDGFQADPKRGRMIIFATDGEDTLDTDAASQAKRAGEMGIPIYTVGIGTPQGAMIPDRPDIFGRIMPKMYKGQPIIAKTNPDTLRKIASLSGGRYFEGSSPESLNETYEALRKLKRGAGKSPDRYVRDPLYQKPLWTAIILLLLEMLISNRSGGIWQGALKSWSFTKRVFSRRTRIPAATLLVLALCCMAFSLDPGREENDLGNGEYRQGQFDKATQEYESSLAQSPQRFDPNYNLGNAKYMQGDYDGAIQAYEDALKINPNDDDAKYNLDLAKRRKEEQKNDKKDDKKDSKDKKSGDKNGQKNQSGQGQQKGQNQGNQSGNQQGQQQGQGKGQQGKSGQGQGQPQQGNGQDLSQDQIRAMMNMLKSDQKQYGQAFQPLKKYQKQDDQNQDPMSQMFEEMTGRKLHPTPVPADSDRKDW